MRGRPIFPLAVAATAAVALALGSRSLSSAAFTPSAPSVRAPAVRVQATAQAKVETEVKAKAPKAAGKPKPAPKKPPAKRRPLPKKPAEPAIDQFTTGILAPLVVIGYAIFGEPFIGKVRGKGIGLHTQVINAFCARFAIPSKKRQGFIKTAKKTGKELGFLIPGGHWGDGLIGESALQWYKDAGIDRWDASNW